MDDNSSENSKHPGRPPNGTPDWAEAFLSEIMSGSHVREAAKKAGIDESMPYKRRWTDDDFSKAWGKASRIGTKVLEAEAERRAFHGTLKPVFQKGVEVGRIREYSDTLLMFLLKARRPKKYRENVEHKHTGAIGHVVMTVVEEIREASPMAVIQNVNGNGKHHHEDDQAAQDTA